MGTGNPGVSLERPRPVPLKTLTLGAGRGISRVRVWVWRGFEGIRVEPRVTRKFGDTIIYRFNHKLHNPTAQTPLMLQSLVGGGAGSCGFNGSDVTARWPSPPFEIPPTQATPASSTKTSRLGGSAFAQSHGRNFKGTV